MIDKIRKMLRQFVNKCRSIVVMIAVTHLGEDLLNSVILLSQNGL